MSYPHRDNPYEPSAKDGPDGPRDNDGQLRDIEANTAKFGEENHLDGALDPFSPINAPRLSLIVQMRIYDVLMAILNESDPDAATRLHELHSKGGILGSLPSIDLRDE